MAIFFIVLPFILLNANGYKFNFKKRSLEKTGIIFLEAKPLEVNIYLNDKLVDNLTPIRIKNLLPNEYTIKLSKESFIDWKKTIRIKEGQTEIVQYIRLFKKDEVPINLISGNIIQVVQGNDNNNLLILQKEDKEYTIIFFNSESKEKKEIMKIDEEIEDIEWIENDSKILVHLKNNILLVDRTIPENIINLEKTVGKKLNRVKIDKFNSNNFYYLINGRLAKYNLLNQEETIFPYEASDYLVNGSEIYFLNNSSLNKTFLKKVNLSKNNNIETLFSLDRSLDYVLEKVDNKNITIRQKDDLIVWNKEKAQSERIKDVKGYSWDSGGNQLLFSNGFELWIYSPDKKRNNYILLTRTGEDIKDAIWYKPETHIIYIVGKQLKIIENLESNRYEVTVLELKNMKNILLNKKADKVYFVGQIGNRKGLYSLSIQ